MEKRSPTGYLPQTGDVSARLIRHNSDPAMLNTVQKEILRILGETGGTDRGTLAAKMDGKATESEVEREFATLKHMDRVGAEKRDGVIFLRAL